MKVLIAEDEKISCRALEHALKKWGYIALTANDGKEAWDILKKNDIRLAILDWMMPEIDGVELCKKIRISSLDNKSKYTYIILLTGRNRQEDIIEGLSAGADDYIAKPYDFDELKIRISNGRRIIKLEDNRIKLATIDSLTKLWNREKIVDFLEEELSRSSREKYSLGLIMIDIDNFKKINDTHGHFIGDEVLIEVASRLKKSVRSYDRIGRYGGDEILVVLPNCGSDEVKIVAERLCSSISKKAIETQINPLDVSISIGATSAENLLTKSKNDFIKNCDKALLKAKKRGKNQIVFGEKR